jgi:hypothetical protein
MILFNWAKIYAWSKGRPAKIIDIIEYMTYKKIPLNKQDPILSYAEIKWSGKSFLVNPELLLNHKKDYKEKELAQYVGIAGFRNLSDFIVLGKTTLDLAQCPVRKDTIINNRLLTIENDKIYLKWEEVTRRNKNGSV